MTPALAEALTPSSTGILADVSQFVVDAVEWMKTFLTTITGDTSKVLVTFVVCVPLVGLGVGLLSRLIHTRG